MKTIEWNDEYEADSNGDDKIVMSEDKAGRFDISPVYVQGENPSYFTCIDHEQKRNGHSVQHSADSVAQCKKWALAQLNARVWTQEERIERAAREWYMNRNTKFAAGIARRALARYGVDVTTFSLPDEVKAAIDGFVAAQAKQWEGK